MNVLMPSYNRAKLLFLALLACAVLFTNPLCAADNASSAQKRSATQPAHEPLITVIRGELPIILVAPHGGESDVPDTPARAGGEGIYRFITLRDVNTAELTERVAQAIERELGGKPHVVIARFHRKFADANRAPRDAYEHENARVHYDAFHGAIRAASEQIRRDFGCGILLDIHGQGTDVNAIYRGTRDGEAVRELITLHGNDAVTGPESVFGHLTAAGYRTWPTPAATQIGIETHYRGGHIVDAHGSHRGTSIDAIQMEFGTTLRKPDRIEQTATDVAKAVATSARQYLPLQEPAAAE